MIRRIWDWLMQPAPQSCLHQWEQIDVQPHKRFYKEGELLIGHVYTMRCKHCGDITKRDITVAG
jgi:hypothetical protein